MDQDIAELAEKAPELVIRTAMALLGQRTSEKKAHAVRLNGQRGGRPKGTALSSETRAKIAAANRAAWARRKGGVSAPQSASA